MIAYVLGLLTSAFVCSVYLDVKLREIDKPNNVRHRPVVKEAPNINPKNYPRYLTWLRFEVVVNAARVISLQKHVKPDDIEKLISLINHEYSFFLGYAEGLELLEDASSSIQGGGNSDY